MTYSVHINPGKNRFQVMSHRYSKDIHSHVTQLLLKEYQNSSSEKRLLRRIAQAKLFTLQVAVLTYFRVLLL